jgi:cyclophilin family peptidyl-prolyl cis-trans isomerase
MRPFALLGASLALVVVALLLVFWNGRGADDGATPTSVVADAPSAEPADAPPAEATDAPAAEAPVVEADATPEAEPETAGAEPEAPAGDDAVPADAEDAAAESPPVPVPDGYEALAPLADERRVAFEAADDVLDPTLDYAAVIETNRGTLVVDLFEAETPITVNNFVFLARHRYYDGIVFHRVIDGFMAQTGDPTGTGTGGPGYRFDDEIVAGLGHDGPGVLSMANAGPGTNGSQFFLTFDATPWLDGAHTVFGRVLDGLPVLDAIHRVDPQQPSVVALLSDPASEVRAQGIDLPGDGTVEEALTTALGAPPVPGPSLEVAGARVAIGTIGTDPAAGFFPFPDRMERVTIVARPRE